MSTTAGVRAHHLLLLPRKIRQLHLAPVRRRRAATGRRHGEVHLGRGALLTAGTGSPRATGAPPTPRHPSAALPAGVPRRMGNGWRRRCGVSSCCARTPVQGPRSGVWTGAGRRCALLCAARTRFRGGRADRGARTASFSRGRVMPLGRTDPCQLLLILLLPRKKQRRRRTRRPNRGRGESWEGTRVGSHLHRPPTSHGELRVTRPRRGRSRLDLRRRKGRALRHKSRASTVGWLVTTGHSALALSVARVVGILGTLLPPAPCLPPSTSLA